MKLTFRIRYHTIRGEEVRVLFHGDESHTIPLSTRNGFEWQGTCNHSIPENGHPLSYCYGIYRNGTCIRKELGTIPHTLYPGNAQQQHYIIDDCWRDLPAENYRYSSAFNLPYTPSGANRLNNNIGSCITFRALCPVLRMQKQQLGLIGSCNALGNWEYCRPIRMQEVASNVWQLTLDASTLKSPFEYKFVAVNEETGAVEEWEERPNRIFQIQPLQRGETYLPAEAEVLFRHPPCRITGTTIPICSLRSEGSCGIGDFGDLKAFIRWAYETGQRIVHIRSINDICPTQTSACTLNILYTDLRQLPALKNEEEMKAFEKQRITLNALPKVDYEKVGLLKQKYLRTVFEQEGRHILATPDFHDFFHKNQAWLLSYTTSRIPHGLQDTMFHYFTQYLLHTQLLDACAYGRSVGVIVMSDFPEDAGPWWQTLIRKLSEYFTAYCIPHIQEFSHRWRTPSHCVHETLGQFIPSLPLTKEEIQSFGIRFDEERMTRPSIDDELLDKWFGEKGHEVRCRFLKRLPDGRYALKTRFNTQSKVQAYFAGKTEEADITLRDKLYALIGNVLFIADCNNPEHYHPHINVRNTPAFRQLNEKDRQAINRLYDHYFYQRHNEFWYAELLKNLSALLRSTPMLACVEYSGEMPEYLAHALEQLQIPVISHQLESSSLFCLLTWKDWTGTDEPSGKNDRMPITLEKLAGLADFNSRVREMIKTRTK